MAFTESSLIYIPLADPLEKYGKTFRVSNIKLNSSSDPQTSYYLPEDSSLPAVYQQNFQTQYISLEWSVIDPSNDYHYTSYGEMKKNPYISGFNLAIYENSGNATGIDVIENRKKIFEASGIQDNSYQYTITGNKKCRNISADVTFVDFTGNKSSGIITSLNPAPTFDITSTGLLEGIFSLGYNNTKNGLNGVYAYNFTGANSGSSGVFVQDDDFMSKAVRYGWGINGEVSVELSPGDTNYIMAVGSDSYGTGEMLGIFESPSYITGSGVSGLSGAENTPLMIDYPIEASGVTGYRIHGGKGILYSFEVDYNTGSELIETVYGITAPGPSARAVYGYDRDLPLDSGVMYDTTYNIYNTGLMYIYDNSLSLQSGLNTGELVRNHKIVENGITGYLSFGSGAGSYWDENCPKYSKSKSAQAGGGSSGSSEGGLTQIGQSIDGPESYQGYGYHISLNDAGDIMAIGVPSAGTNQPGAAKIFKNENGVWTQIGQTIVGDAVDHRLGSSISLNAAGDIVAIGAASRSSVSTPLNGYARIFKNNAGTWTQIGADLTGSAAGDKFGNSISLNSAGDTVVIGAPMGDPNGTASGYVRVFRDHNGIWSTIGYMAGTVAYDRYGHSVSINNEGNVIAIGTPYRATVGPFTGIVEVFEKPPGMSWVKIGSSINGANVADFFGYSVSLNGDGSVVAAGALHADSGQWVSNGEVRVFKNQAGTWTQVGSDINGDAGSDSFGYAVAINGAGDVLIAASSNHNSTAGQAKILKNEGGEWKEIGAVYGDQNGERLGSSLAINSAGDIVAIGAPLRDNGPVTNGGQVRAFSVEFSPSPEIHGEAEEYWYGYYDPQNQAFGCLSSLEVKRGESKINGIYSMPKDEPGSYKIQFRDGDNLAKSYEQAASYLNQMGEMPAVIINNSQLTKLKSLNKGPGWVGLRRGKVSLLSGLFSDDYTNQAFFDETDFGTGNARGIEVHNDQGKNESNYLYVNDIGYNWGWTNSSGTAIYKYAGSGYDYVRESEININISKKLSDDEVYYISGNDGINGDGFYYPLYLTSDSAGLPCSAHIISGKTFYMPLGSGANPQQSPPSAKHYTPYGDTDLTGIKIKGNAPKPNIKSVQITSGSTTFSFNYLFENNFLDLNIQDTEDPNYNNYNAIQVDMYTGQTSEFISSPDSLYVSSSIYKEVSGQSITGQYLTLQDSLTGENPSYARIVAYDYISSGEAYSINQELIAVTSSQVMSVSLDDAFYAGDNSVNVEYPVMQSSVPTITCTLSYTGTKQNIGYVGAMLNGVPTRTQANFLLTSKPPDTGYVLLLSIQSN